MKILADRALPNLKRFFTSPFSLTHYTTDKEVPDLLPNHDILLCRSTLKVTAALLANSSIQCVATASSGTDHIDRAYLKQHKIALFDAKGCNAVAVADYVTATLAYLYRNHLVTGQKAGIIGVGQVGQQVMTRLKALGFDVIYFDPQRQAVDTDYPYCTVSALTQCDVLCVHPNLHSTEPYPSVNLIDSDFLNQLKAGMVIINAARGGIVDEQALLKTIKPITYCTDVYQDEPNVNPAIIEFSTLCTPHIAGHTIEAKNNAVMKISQQIHQHYGLSQPQPSNSNLTNQLTLSASNNWINHILSLYNPLSDTLMLKSAPDKKLAFLNQRDAHTTRHDFSFYDSLN